VARSYRRWHRRGGLDRRSILAAVLAGLVLAAVAHGHRPAASHGVRPPATLARVPSTAAANVALGRRLAAGYGWSHGSRWHCLHALWARESGWSATATNPRSGAYGIAQALGHGPTNQYPPGPANPPTSDPATQIRWGLSYIAATYGTPCGAWTHETADGWY
jgi:resuscitation-promoting factor RpfB